MWRQADEELLFALETEVALRRAGAHPETARRLAPLARALGGSAPGALEAPAPGALRALPPRALHRLTVLATRRLGSAADARAAIAGWAILAVHHRGLLSEIACTAAGGDAAAAQAGLARVHLRGVEAVGQATLGTLDSLAPLGAELFAILGETRALLEVVDAAPSSVAEIASRAATLRTSVLGALTGPIERAVSDLRATQWTAAEAAECLSRAERAWRWTGQDRALAELVVRALPDLAWPLHQAQRWDELRALLGPIEAPSVDLARRLRADPTDVAYRAAAAQALVFLAETAGTLERQLELAEDALATCDTLRNARVVCADRLACKAEGLLGRSHAPDATAAAEALARRARALHPTLRRLPALEEALARRRAAGAQR